MTQAICRTALFMPASNARAMEKATTLSADAIIIDLEDSVAPNAKAQARVAAVKALVDNDYGYRLRVLRINGPDTPWFKDDMAAVSDASPDAVLLPKVESADMVQSAQEQLDRADPTGKIKLWAMMETPKAIVHAQAIAEMKMQCARLDTLCIGTNDLVAAANMKMTSDRTLLLPWILQLVLIAKAYDLRILDGVYNDFADVPGFDVECEQGAAIGMDGKTLIHPKQIAPANLKFAPSEHDVANAQLIVDTFAQPENNDAGVVQIEGRMVERLHRDLAQQTLNFANQVKARL